MKRNTFVGGIVATLLVGFCSQADALVRCARRRVASRIPGVGLLILAVSLVATSTAIAARSTEMYRMEPRPYRVAKGVTTEQVRGAIVESVELNGWRTAVRADGTVEAVMVVRGGKHTATVKIAADNGTFAVNYLDSFNLGYKEVCRRPPKFGPKRRRKREVSCYERIHPDYNEWVRRIEHDIERHLARLQADHAVRATPGPAKLFIADELIKLQALREGGVLSEEEFEAQKRRLLDAK